MVFTKTAQSVLGQTNNATADLLCRSWLPGAGTDLSGVEAAGGENLAATGSSGQRRSTGCRPPGRPHLGDLAVQLVRISAFGFDQSIGRRADCVLHRYLRFLLVAPLAPR